MQSSTRLITPARALTTLSLLLVLLFASALAAKGAAIRLPVELAENPVRIEFTGFGGYNKGRYTGAEFRGDFTRIESRLGIFDPLYVANRGKSSFTVENPDGTVQLAASCRMTERTGTYRIVTIDLDKLAYECEFSGPEAEGVSRFVLGEPKREGFREKLLARDRRVGEAFVLDRLITIESIHEYEGSRLKSQTPLGYLLQSEGTVIAAVDLLDWNPIVNLHEDSAEPTQRAAMIVALALAVLRDPANSALED